MGEAAREKVQASYAWDSSLARIDQLLDGERVRTSAYSNDVAEAMS
jgi:hypothetical protein